ncbi:hypothetical protein [Stenotrophomonas maltophilia]|uniref:Uncharacterized protein n=1 Tax=Stenotrophomonas maltophilia TaxID=40324 RepID=A0A4S2CV38_STEMA|nr:hypothetical protein [Stenotrophomonas maltophilia]QIO87297.1 hypothetical protein G9274_000982 [Stenotrophomonas rhizophila]TGY32341.1 hypothetical protein E5352_16375 [Stenotrophomonas maltophilia]
MAAPAWSFVLRRRRRFGIAALWATLCVVLLGLAWPGDSGRPGAPGRPAAAVEAAGHSTLDLVSHAQPAPAPVPEGVHAARLGSETGGDAESDSTAIRRASHRTPWIARVPLWRADALRWQRLEPALRLNPGHAPPYA